jgi:hypothetical protein
MLRTAQTAFVQPANYSAQASETSEQGRLVLAGNKGHGWSDVVTAVARLFN